MDLNKPFTKLKEYIVVKKNTYYVRVRIHLCKISNKHTNSVNTKKNQRKTVKLRKKQKNTKKP
jgi:hypothetical protein